MKLLAATDALHELVDPHVEVEELAEDLAFTEGPAWDRGRHCLLFHDIPNERRYRWSERDGLEEVVRHTAKANGMAFDPQGRLLVCEHGHSRVVRLEPDGGTTILAAEYEGRALNSPNDVIVRSDGLVYFSDPPYGRISPEHGVPRPMELDHRGLYAVHPDTREIRLLVDDFEAPNGMCFSVDESVLYVNDSERWHVRRFEVAEDGSLTGGDVWVKVDDDSLGEGNPDGMKLDEQGNVWVTGPGGIWVFSPEGERLGVVCMPRQAVNFTWGGDGRELYVCATSSVFRTWTKVRGAR